MIDRISVIMKYLRNWGQSSGTAALNAIHSGMVGSDCRNSMAR